VYAKAGTYFPVEERIVACQTMFTFRYDVTFEVFTPVTMKYVVFWDDTPFGWLL
jgi:hypothetical protein